MPDQVKTAEDPDIIMRGFDRALAAAATDEDRRAIQKLKDALLLDRRRQGPQRDAAVAATAEAAARAAG